MYPPKLKSRNPICAIYRFLQLCNKVFVKEPESGNFFCWWYFQANEVKRFVFQGCGILSKETLAMNIFVNQAWPWKLWQIMSLCETFVDKPFKVKLSFLPGNMHKHEWWGRRGSWTIIAEEDQAWKIFQYPISFLDAGLNIEERHFNPLSPY